MQDNEETYTDQELEALSPESLEMMWDYATDITDDEIQEYAKDG